MKKIFGCDDRLIVLESREKDKIGYRAKFLRYNPKDKSLQESESIFIKPKKNLAKNNFKFIDYAYVDNLFDGM